MSTYDARARSTRELFAGTTKAEGGGRPPLGARVMLWAIIAAMLAITALIVAVTFWFVLMILPAVLLLGLAGYLAWRYQIWRARHGVLWRGPPGP